MLGPTVTQLMLGGSEWIFGLKTIIKYFKANIKIIKIVTSRLEPHGTCIKNTRFLHPVLDPDPYTFLMQ